MTHLQQVNRDSGYFALNIVFAFLWTSSNYCIAVQDSMHSWTRCTLYPGLLDSHSFGVLYHLLYLLRIRTDGPEITTLTFEHPLSDTDNEHH